MAIIYDFKDIIFTNLIQSMIKYLSEESYSKVINSFPKVELPQEIPSKDQILREIYRKNTSNWWEDEPISEEEAIYKNKWFILGCISIITIGLTWYFYEDLSNYFKPSDGANGASISKGKFIDSTRSQLDKAKLSRLERFKQGIPSPDSKAAKTISRSSSNDTITLSNATKDAAVITSTGEVTNTVASSSNESSSRLRFSPQHSSKEMGVELKTFFKSPDSPDSGSSSSGSLDSPTTPAPKAPLPGDKGSFFSKTYPNLMDIWKEK
jgi:hypothetical protein